MMMMMMMMMVMMVMMMMIIYDDDDDDGGDDHIICCQPYTQGEMRCWFSCAEEIHWRAFTAGINESWCKRMPGQTSSTSSSTYRPASVSNCRRAMPLWDLPMLYGCSSAAVTSHPPQQKPCSCPLGCRWMPNRRILPSPLSLCSLTPSPTILYFLGRGSATAPPRHGHRSWGRRRSAASDGGEGP